ncbi:hypothetical protein GIB67_018034 [Kingdonia uniflora]|uniref:Uncharacterized protein n=1 Tax=Kingdonia uniflora TaxID=39325 RepID=A0A7J7NWR8_9MAGN|nr:hypothetical protein GIB67_018034 [Kingdonia uniflora]
MGHSFSDFILSTYHKCPPRFFPTKTFHHLSLFSQFSSLQTLISPHLRLFYVLRLIVSGCDAILGMVTKNMEFNLGDDGLSCGLPAPSDQLRSRAGNMVFKSGPLFISSKGIGWTSWKKRWFILTRTSLVFFRSDPNIILQKGSDVNLTLGGIDLNNSGSVVVREDKKLLTVLFPDGCDGRAFTLKAETSEDLNDWKTALEKALTQAPSAALLMGQNGIFRNDPADIVDGPTEQWRDRRPLKSLVVGRPILLALEDIDGAPSFLEKALNFIEQYGVQVEGILRQAADVDDVEHRVQEYEQGKNEFSPEEDAHIIADCVKHIIRQLPSSPVPASCCNALLEACRTEPGGRVSAMRTAISETFPEPNRRLLQRILRMMQAVASRKSENRMSSSAVAACMAPLLLRPLLAGDCQLDNNFHMGGGDGSVQLLQAAAAANHAQAIVITLMEEYDNIFQDDSLLVGSISPELYSESEESVSEDEKQTDDDDELLEDDRYPDSQDGLDDDTEDAVSGSSTEATVNGDDDDQDGDKVFEGSYSPNEDFEANANTSSGSDPLMSQHENAQSNVSLQRQNNTSSVVQASAAHVSQGDVPASRSLELKSTDCSPSSGTILCAKESNQPGSTARRRTVWGRTSARKNLSMESIDFTIEDEVAIQKLETTKSDFQNKIAKKAKENEVLHGSLERLKQALLEQRLALEQDVTKLREQLQRERDLKDTMEAELNTTLRNLHISDNTNEKTKAELEEIAQTEVDVTNLKQKVAYLHMQLDQQRRNNCGPVCESCSQLQQNSPNFQARKKYQETSEPTYAERLLVKSAPSELALKELLYSQQDSLTRADYGEVRIQDPPLLPKIRTAEKQQRDSAVYDNTKKSIGAATLSSLEAVTVEATALSSSKKSGVKIEGTVTTSSALSKLTNRLNFLKERRTQIVNELQNMENSRPSEIQSLGAPARTNSR